MRRILKSSTSALALQWEAEKIPTPATPKAGDLCTFFDLPGTYIVKNYTDPKTKKPMIAMDIETRGLHPNPSKVFRPDNFLGENIDRRYFVYDEASDTPQSAWDHFRNGGGVGFDISSAEGLRAYQRFSADRSVDGGVRTTVWPPIADSVAPQNMDEFRRLYLQDWSHLTATGRVPSPPPFQDFPPNIGKSQMNETYRKIKDLILDYGVVVPRGGYVGKAHQKTGLPFDDLQMVWDNLESVAGFEDTKRVFLEANKAELEEHIAALKD